MAIHTCSQAVSFAKELEDRSSGFYRALSEKFIQGKEDFLSFAKENGGYAGEIERAYYGVITDAIEGCFTFNIDPEKYRFEADLKENTSASDVLDRALEIEDNIIRFYTDAAEQSKSLLADVPRVFKMVAQKRIRRQSKLKSMQKVESGY